MKTLLFSFTLLTSIVQYTFAQDIIYKHNGETLNVKVRYLTESKVIYGFAGESKSYYIGKPEVEKIVYESGYQLPITRKIVVQGANGWKNVVITYNQFDVIGLRKKGELVSNYGDKTEARKKSGDRKEAEKIQKTAAALGGHIVYVRRENIPSASEKDKIEKDQQVVIYGY